MPFFRTVAGLRVSLIVWSALLLANVILWVVDPADWLRHLPIAVAPVLGLVVTVFHLRRIGMQRSRSAAVD